MTKIFGTDGARGLVTQELDSELALKIGAATARILKKKRKKLTFLVGTDTRVSKDLLTSALTAGVLGENANIVDLGVIPTPAISYLITKYKADGGFVISASHNPKEYNGIKVFNNKGFKLADEIEDQIEDIILNDFETTKDNNLVGTYRKETNAYNDYVDYLVSTIDTKLDGLHIGIDTANGAASVTAPLLFEKLNAKVEFINNTPDGYNINDKCGSTHLEQLQKFVVEKKLDCGIAYDGDADRCLFIDNKGNVIDGDYTLAIYGLYLKKKKKLKNNTIVGTIMSNLGFIKFCEANNINFEATKVGDRYVLENMLKNNYIIGGEQSGHIIFKDFANTGDGELTCLQILNIMTKENKSLSELASIMNKYPQVLKNLPVSKEIKETYKDNKNIQNKIKEIENKLGNNGRLLIRPSGTENLIRVMLEGQDIKEITKYCDDIIETIKKEIEE
ncbi:MAG: phosphoglucosamine mutase [Bacilli bacterium]|nr:phosphoglucosamine mutase [Bacilli bacterium]